MNPSHYHEEATENDGRRKPVNHANLAKAGLWFLYAAWVFTMLIKIRSY